MSSPDPEARATVAVELDETTVECGEILTGTVSWSGYDAVRRVIVTLEVTAVGGKRTSRIKPLEVEVSVDDNGPARFAATVPRGGPISYAGELLEVRWEVKARLDLARARDPSTQSEFAVVPGGGIDLLARRQAPPPQS